MFLALVTKPLVRVSSWSNRRAIVNARVASIECSRRRLERAEVAAYLAARVPASRTA